MFTLICPASPLTYSSRLIAFVVNLDLSSSILLFLATVFLALLVTSVAFRHEMCLKTVTSQDPVIVNVMDSVA